MQHRRRAFVPILMALAIAACTPTASSTTPTSESTASAADPEAAPVTGSTVLAATHFAVSDLEWEESQEITISLMDGGSAGGDGVTVAGDVVTVVAPGSYRISGSLTNGQVLVDTEEAGIVRLILDGVSIANTTGAAVAVANADEVVVVLAEGSTNELADAASYVFPSEDVDEPNAALFSNTDLTIAGSGSLSITGNFNDGIASKDGLVIVSGVLDVTAVDDGIRGKDYLVVQGGSLDVSARGDALKADNAEDASLGYVSIAGGSVTLTAGVDGIDAITAVTIDEASVTIDAGDDGIHSDARLEVAGGTIDIQRSYEGIEGTQITISGGDIAVIASDDGLNVAGGDASAGGPGGAPAGGAGQPPAGGGGGNAGGFGGGEAAVAGSFVEISGGTLVIDAEGDGFDSNGTATITGGTIIVNGPTESMNGALDVNGEFMVSGGTIVAAGSARMVVTPSASSTVPTLDILFDATEPAGTLVTIRDGSGNTILSFAPSKTFQSLVISSPDLESGASYEVLVGGTSNGSDLAGLFLDGETSGATSLGNVAAS